MEVYSLFKSDQVWVGPSLGVLVDINQALVSNVKMFGPIES